MGNRFRAVGIRWPRTNGTMSWPRRPTDGFNDTMQMNRVVIAGYVSKTPEVRRLPSGTPVANVQVGESVRYADGSGETRELTNWHSLSFYGKLADVAQALKTGDNVYVDGRIEQRQLIARDGSKPRTVHEVVVSQRHLIA